MNFRTYYDLNHLISYGLYKIPKDIDLIVGIPRSGLMVASIISLYLNLPLVDLDSFLEGRMFSCGNTKKRNDWVANVNEVHKILLVDDTSFSGKAALDAIEKIKASNYKEEFVFLICYVTEQTKNIPNIYLEVLDSPRMFEWNYFHQKNIGYACFDLDGVLCLNPTKEQDDDGEKYLDFIQNANLRVAPSREIGHIITCRLEKYREQTENWLKKNGIKYKELIMMQYDSYEERKNANSNGKFKGEIYKNISDSFIFFESSPNQAEEIAKISGKLVFCTSNHKVYS